MEEKNFDKLDYTIKDLEQRITLVNNIVNQHEKAKIPINSQYLTAMADYCLGLDIKKAYKNTGILTKNRMITIYKREQSYESLKEMMPDGDNDIYSLINDNPKGTYLTSRTKITKEDIDNTPELQTIKQEIERLKESVKNATGKELYILKKTLIDLEQDQYIIKTLKTQQNMGLLKSTKSPKSTGTLCINEDIYEGDNGDIKTDAIVNLTDPEHVKALLHYYVLLKEDTWDKLDSDLRYLLWELEDRADEALMKQKPIWYKIMIRKIDGASNEDIAAELKLEMGVDLSINTISTIWCNSIPKAIAKQAAKHNTIFYYKKNNKKMKICNRCGKLLPPNKLFFHTNNKAADKLYSICKECRKDV